MKRKYDYDKRTTLMLIRAKDTMLSRGHYYLYNAYKTYSYEKECAWNDIPDRIYYLIENYVEEMAFPDIYQTYRYEFAPSIVYYNYSTFTVGAIIDIVFANHYSKKVFVYFTKDNDYIIGIY